RRGVHVFYAPAHEYVVRNALQRTAASTARDYRGGSRQSGMGRSHRLTYGAAKECRVSTFGALKRLNVCSFNSDWLLWCLTGKGEKGMLSLLVVLCILCSLIISFDIFQDSIVSSDEWSYLIQAHIFSHGRLAVPSPMHREFFDHVHIVNNGRYYSKYPPGWPCLLAIGVFLGVPRLVNPVLGAGTLLLIYAIGKKLYTPQIALLAVLLALVSPYFLFNTASYFAHTASLFFVALLFFLLMKGWEERSCLYFFLAG